MRNPKDRQMNPAPVKTSKSTQPYYMDPTVRLDYTDDGWNLYRDGVTQGLLMRFMTCPEKHRLAMQERLELPRGGGALSFGSIIHDALDQVVTTWKKMLLQGKNIRWQDAVKWVPGVLDSMYATDKGNVTGLLQPDPDAVTQLELNYGMARPLLEGYFKQWRHDFSKFEFVDMEKIFDISIPTPTYLSMQRPAIRIRGKIDAIVKIKGKYWLLETKTKSRIEDENIIDTISFDMQTNLYMWFMRIMLGEMPAGVIYNVMRRPQLRLGKTETVKEYLDRVARDIYSRPAHYYVRFHCTSSEEEFTRWEGEFRALLRTLIAWQEGYYHYRNPTSCSGRFGTCEYLSICGRGDRSRYTVRQELFPELKPVADTPSVITLSEILTAISSGKPEAEPETPDQGGSGRKGRRGRRAGKSDTGTGANTIQSLVDAAKEQGRTGENAIQKIKPMGEVARGIARRYD